MKPWSSINWSNGKVVEIDFGKIDKGVIRVGWGLAFGANGEYVLKGVFVANGINLETWTGKAITYFLLKAEGQ